MIRVLGALLGALTFSGCTSINPYISTCAVQEVGRRYNAPVRRITCSAPATIEVSCFPDGTVIIWNKPVSKELGQQ